MPLSPLDSSGLPVHGSIYSDALDAPTGIVGKGRNLILVEKKFCDHLEKRPLISSLLISRPFYLLLPTVLLPWIFEQT